MEKLQANTAVQEASCKTGSNVLKASFKNHFKNTSFQIIWPNSKPLAASF